jgi:hypothetical protein
MADQKLCTVCGAIGTTKRNMKGSLFTELVLWFFFVLPGLIYSIWRHSTVAQVCRTCESAAVIPLNSPAAQQVLANRRVTEQIKPHALGSAVHAHSSAPSRRSSMKIALAVVAGFALIDIIIISMSPAELTNREAQSNSTPAVSSTAEALVPASTGNRAQDKLETFTDNQQAAFLGYAVQEGCEGTQAYYMGMDHRHDAFWSVMCANGRSYNVEISPDSTGSTRILDCSVLQAVAGMSCFTKLDN